MELLRTVRGMQSLADDERAAGNVLALVPTMGALHDGHLAIVDHAKQRGDRVTVSIFVNPTQFAPGEDFERYPRQLERDLQLLEARGGVDAVFAPDVGEMYPEGDDRQQVWLDVGEIAAHLCGRYRPGHFQGVVTVVAKLFHACKPHVALFGQKDAQQLVILKRMVRDLLFDVEVVGVPTQREADGLAFSSRNVYLDEVERRDAVVLSRAVDEARRQVEAGEQRPQALVESMRKIIGEAPHARPQYVEVVDAETLQPLDRIEPGRDVLAAVAVYFGNTRLIDNAFAQAPGT